MSNTTFVENSSIQVSGRSTVSLVRKQSMIEAESSSTLFLFVCLFVLCYDFLLLFILHTMLVSLAHCLSVGIDLACYRNICDLKAF
jgi:hypothetical protein